MELKEIAGFTDYYVSEKGIVYTTKISPRYNKKGELRVLKPRIHPSGYLYYGFFVGTGKWRKRYWRRGHRLVWEAFMGKITRSHQIDHINFDKHDNRLENLQCISAIDNVRRFHKALADGTYPNIDQLKRNN